MPQFENRRARVLSRSAVAAFVGAALVGTAQAATLTVGPVEHVNLKTATIVVLGQNYHVDASTLIRNRAGAVTGLGSLAPYTVVSITGTETATGRATVKSVTALPEVDVPGATQLLVTGVVSSQNVVGEIKVGGLTVDVNATLTSDTPKFQVGNLVEITGTQPNPGGIFLAQNVIALAGVSGSGAAADLGVSGSGAKADLGVSGSGAAADLGVSGSGAAADLGVSGSGAAADLGVSGSGAAADLGVSGSGAKADLGVSGSGAAADLGVSGSGAAADLGVSGSGAAADLGVSGSGAAADLGVSGSGAAADLGVSGSGAAADLGVSGSGAAADLGVSGSGAKADLGVSGSGKK